MIQDAHATGLAQIYQAAGDLIVYGGEEPYRWAPCSASVAPPDVSEARSQPSELLRAANALIDFTGRHDVMTELENWRDGDGRQGMAVHLIHGPGGQGKTRLAGHVAQRWQRKGWVVLAAHHRRDRSTADHFEVPEFAGVAGVLVVVDYAERWDTADLLTLLRDARLPGRLPLRVLLLARPAGTWWQSLEGRIQRDLDLVPSRQQLQPLEQEAGISRGDLFATARDRFAELLQVPGVGVVNPPSALDRHEAYQLVLTVHMAALAAVLAHDRGQDPPIDPVQVSGFLLARERDHWEAMSSPSREKPLATSPDAMGQVVYTATVTGRLDYADGKDALARADIDSAQAVGQLLKDHAMCYPPSESAEPGRVRQQAASAHQTRMTVLEPLYPDRLGEDFLALSTAGHGHNFPADPWADNALARLLAPPVERSDAPGEDSGVPAWARHGLITLIEAARRWPHLASQQVYPLLTRHPRLALQGGGAALAALAGLDDIEPTLLEAIESVLPGHRHIDLDIGAAAVASRLAESRLAEAIDPATHARIHASLAIRLSYAGLHSRALAEGGQAAQIWRYLADIKWDAYLPDLATSLNNHAALLAQVGQRSEAAAVSEEAVRLYRGLAKTNRDAYLPGLATALINHALRLAEVGQRSEAAAVSEEAVHLRQGLANTNSDAHLPDLAAWLHNHALRLAEVGQPSEAVPASEEAVRLNRELAKTNRDAHLPDLAASLTSHANLLAKIGQHSNAVPASEEAVRLNRELAKTNSDAYLPGLATSLTNHAALLTEVEHHKEAVPVSEEAVRLRRELAKTNRDAYLPDLATTLNNHAVLLAKVEHHKEAVPVSEEAVRLRRELAKTNRDAYLPDLAMSLSNHAVLLAQLEHHKEAVPVSEEALRLRRELAKTNRDAYLPDLAASLANHAALLTQLGQHNEAVTISEEAVRLRRELAKTNRDAYLPDLAMSLSNHAVLLVQLGRRGEAVTISEEAVRLRRELAEANPDAHLLGYVQSLAVLGLVLVEGARFREAIVPLAEALSVGQQLPEYAQDIVGAIVEQLRRAHARDAHGVSERFREVTGQDVPDWMKQPPNHAG